MSTIANTIFSPALAARFDQLVTIYPLKRSALVPMLLYAQDEIGYVSDAVVAEIAQRLDLLELDVRNVLSYYSMLRTKPAGKYNVQVCTNISCMLRGGYEILDHCKHKPRHRPQRASRPTASSRSKKSSASAPAAGPPPSRSTTTSTTTSRPPRWTPSSPTTPKAGHDGKGPKKLMPTLVSHPDEVSRLPPLRPGRGRHRQVHRARRLQGRPDGHRQAAPSWIINTMKASGLRGRGGAGFPTGMKWSLRPQGSPKSPSTSSSTATSPSPAPARTTSSSSHDPHAVIEGTMIAGLAIGSKMGFIYLRGEYRYLLKIVEKAVADAYAKGFLGKNIFGIEGLDFDIVTQTGAGAYEVGEESALMESLEGKRGVPRIKPPFPAVVGLYGGPTVINNAETIATAPHILLMGGEAYAKLGSERNGGTRLFGISGHVERPGVYELPMGYSLRKAIYEVAGGIKDGKKLKAVVPGGASCPVLTADEIDVGLDFDQMGKAGTMLGSGGIVVLDETVSIVEFALRTITLLPARDPAAGASPAAKARTGSRRPSPASTPAAATRRTSTTSSTSPKT